MKSDGTKVIHTKEEHNMQYKLTLKSNEDIILPFQYNHILQAAILSMINDEEYAEFIHQKGYYHEKRNYKLYTFSRLIGKAQVDRTNKIFNYGKTCSMYIASMDNKFLTFILSKFLTENMFFRLKQNQIAIDSIELLDTKDLKPSELITTVSPITTYSTLYSPEGKKKTYYYSPYEKEFSENIAANLKKKHFAYHNEYPADDSFEIIPKGGIKESVFNYKGNIVKGWTGDFLLKGSEEMLKAAFAAGLGSRNSIGMGMVIRKGR